MIIPARCFTCGKVTGGLWDLFQEKRQQGKSDAQAYAEIGLERSCCKRMFHSHVQLIDKLLIYNVMTRPPIAFGQKASNGAPK